MESFDPNSRSVDYIYLLLNENQEKTLQNEKSLKEGSAKQVEALNLITLRKQFNLKFLDYLIPDHTFLLRFLLSLFIV